MTVFKASLTRKKKEKKTFPIWWLLTQLLVKISSPQLVALKLMYGKRCTIINPQMSTNTYHQY